MEFIDTHAHLFWDKFDNDIDKVIERAKEVGISKIFNQNVDIYSIELLVKLSEKFLEIIFPVMGLHPGSVRENFEKDLEVIENNLRDGKFYGVGEIGIDLYWDENKKFKEQQIKAFEYQIKLAKELGLPIIIHTREAFDEIFSVVDKLNDEKLFGIFHCFTGTLSQAEKIIDYGGFKMGLGGVITYKKSPLPDVIKQIDLKHFVLETDSPFLPPVPKRGKRNESSFLIYIAEKIAEVHNVSVAEVAEITTSNANEVFGL